MSKKTLIPLTENQASTGPSNAAPNDLVIRDSLIPKASGFVSVKEFELINVDLTATGAAVNLKYAIESLDYWNNVVDIHTGEFLSAGNQIIEIEHNARETIRTNVTEYASGALFASACLSRYNNR